MSVSVAKLSKPEEHLQMGRKTERGAQVLLLMSILDGRRLQYVLRLRSRSLSISGTTE
jgi:hypothetical protein